MNVKLGKDLRKVTTELERHRAKQASIVALKKELAEAKAEARTDQSARYAHR